MASFFLGLNRGEPDLAQGLISNGTTTASDDIELRMDSGKNLTRKDVLLAMEAFEAFIESNSGSFLPPT